MAQLLHHCSHLARPKVVNVILIKFDHFFTEIVFLLAAVSSVVTVVRSSSFCCIDSVDA